MIDLVTTATQAITAEVVRGARARLDRYGLCRDGTYGELDGPCCTIGAVAAAWLERLADREDEDREDEDDSLYTAAEYIAADVVDEWMSWMASQNGLAVSYTELPAWNDSGMGTDDDVRSFYDWWAAQLEAEGGDT